MRSSLFDKCFDAALMHLREEGRYRVFCELEKPLGALPRANWRADGGVREVVTWCSNDYLGMSQHPQVVAALRKAIDDGATGAGGTRNIGGTHSAHVQLEAVLAQLHDKPAALTFTFGYAANLTVPQGAERLRVTPGPHHTDDMIADFVTALRTVLQQEAA